MRVKLFFRKHSEDKFSIERVYSTLITNSSNGVEWIVKEVPFESRGILKRLMNILFVLLNRSPNEIIHITGDIHYTLLLTPKKNSVLTIHDISPIKINKGVKFYLLKYLWFVFPIRRASKIITVSKFSQSEICNNFNLKKENCEVIYNPVHPLFIRNEKTHLNPVPKILQVGTKANKNIERLALALEGISSELIIVGPLDTELKNTLQKLEIKYENHIAVSNQELVKLYHDSDLVSFVSTYEGFGLPIIEAQAVGRVVLTSNCSSMPEIAGEGALFVNPYSVQEIREGITKILNDNDMRARIIQKGYENVERFKFTHILDKYLDLYKELFS